ncbi:16S rRNA (cytidine(1402)-2'-O)-methyltransferase [Rhodopseudomonas pseudopalustris]|uniref:Ribosomal RNA small subunit methyltransferase I n=1 Tax=Rhodopseudomonas pseudopalustris TaxID=1513892 RepID=A0A1H8X569_9BRAD|nr:16S rRNA (cytidine(1402)-2'-O)-methyltransferase [Rhodopseudomonas pseudopalustris]SEP35056.1 16S rRNA (cytidine1402-2'-O)-methyltransferase [Rhodopseudomonas pseudopalustris]
MRAKAAPTIPSTAESEPEARAFLVAGQKLIAPRAAPGLHLVATPIGNLGDITLRALETLAGVDVIACEDTRITHRLTERYGISAQLKPYHEHNAAQARPKILEKLAQGGSVALVSDAGTPLISDPGYKLVREAYDAGHDVVALPGASAVLAALALAALPTDRFFFDGFLPAKQGARRSRLSELAAIDATLVLFEAGSRIHNSLRDLAEVLGEREAAICRELTKLHQEVRRAPLTTLAETAETLETRGEFVVVIGPPDPGARMMTQDALDTWLRDALQRDSVKDAVAQAVDISGRPRREIYARALELARQREADDGQD